jgi:hypothetical protein
MGREVTIKIRAFPYYVTEDNPLTGQPIRRERIARRGETVELSDEDYNRASYFDAIRSEADEDVANAVGDGTSTVDSASIEELAKWLQESKPTVDETVDAAEDDPVVARRLLDAENLATGQQPRKGVEDGLKAIIAQA